MGYRPKRPSCKLQHDADGYAHGARCIDGGNHGDPEPIETLTGATVGFVCPLCGVRMEAKLISNWGGDARYQWRAVNDDGSPIPLLRCPVRHT